MFRIVIRDNPSRWTVGDERVGPIEIEVPKSMTLSGDVTRILRELSAGNRQALERLMPLVYDDLHERAEEYMRKERKNHTLTLTALMHEAYLRQIMQNHAKAWLKRELSGGTSRGGSSK